MPIRWFHLGFLILLFLSCTPQKQALQLSQGNEYSKTESSEKKATPHPRALAYFINGVIAELTGDMLEAALNYEVALRFDTTSETIHSSLAAVYADMGELEKAERLLAKLIRKQPFSAEYLEIRGDIHLQRGEYKQAIEAWESVITVMPDHYSIRYKLIALYELQNQWDAMARHYEAILNQFQDQTAVSVKLGAVYLKMKAYDRAAAVYEKALLFDPNNTYLMEALATTQILKKDYRGAMHTYEKLLSFKTDPTVVHHRIASLAMQLSDYEKALYHYRKIENAYGDKFDVQRGIGFSLYQLKQKNESVPYFDKAIRLNERDILSITLLAGILQDQGQFERSDLYYEKALRLEPDNDLILNNYSYSLAERGVQLEKAFRMAKRALEKSPDNSHYLDTYGWVLYQLGQVDNAFRYIQRSYQIDSTSWEVTMHMGDVLIRLKEPHRALYYFERALQLPGNKSDLLKSKIERLRRELPGEP